MCELEYPKRRPDLDAKYDALYEGCPCKPYNHVETAPGVIVCRANHIHCSEHHIDSEGSE